MIVYMLIATCNAFVWSMLALLLGASQGRTLLLFLLLLPLAFFMLMFVAGCARDCRDLEDDYLTRFYK